MCRTFCEWEIGKATNIIECKRIEDAIECNWGETEDVTHHATIPLSLIRKIWSTKCGCTS